VYHCINVCEHTPSALSLTAKDLHPKLENFINICT